MKKQLPAVFLTLLGIMMMLSLPLQAQQDGDPVAIGTYRTIHSKVLDEGRIVAQGRHDELMEQKGIYKQIYQSQLSGSKVSREKQIEE